MNVSDLEKKLKKLDIKTTGREIADVLGINEQSYSRKRKQGSDIKYGDILKIEQKFNISLIPHTEISVSTSDLSVTLKYYLDVYATCGDGGFCDDGASTNLTIPQSFIRGYNKNEVYSIIEARSNSMSPVIMPYDLLIVKHTNIIEDNKIHIFSMNNKIFCKYLSYNLNEILIKSENREYKNMSVKPNEIVVNGVVVGSIRKF